MKDLNAILEDLTNNDSFRMPLPILSESFLKKIVLFWEKFKKGTKIPVSTV